MPRTRKQRGLTRLGRFIRDNELEPKEVAEITGISRQYLLKLRKGQAEPTRPIMIWITLACRMLLARRVRITQLFCLGDNRR